MADRPSRTIVDYERKRNFGRTPEPPGDRSRDGARNAGLRQFVVHRHEARRLHYDLRLEMGGVLKSWAVPRGFSYDPETRKLAVRTEDHPLAYTGFQGVIPQGEYGGGTMVIWDRGSYRITEGSDNEGIEGVEAGKLVIELRGRKLRGSWHLVRTARGKHEWLLFKGRDRYVRKDHDRQPFFDLPGAVAWTGSPTAIAQEPARDTDPFSDEGWIFEPQLEGRAVFLARAGNDLTLRDTAGGNRLDFPGLLAAARKIRAGTFLAGGTIVAPDAAERPSGAQLAARLAGDRSVRTMLYLNDLLRFEEWDLRPVPLLERKALLSTLLPQSERLLFGQHVAVRGEQFHAACEAAGLPGTIARRAGAPYPTKAGSSSEDAGCLRFPAGGNRSASEDHLLAGLLRERAARSAARPIRFSNLEKVFWPGLGLTKGDLIRYYDQVAEHLLPYLRERPAHLLRHPDGIEGKAFYQKDLPRHSPAWVETEEIPSEGRGETIRYLICNNTASLLFAANLASIDIHPWLSLRTRRDTPDWAVFDLDPGGAPFHDVVRLAKSFGKVLRGIGLRPFVKTSGASGLHIFVPLKPIYPYRVVRQFCEAVSTHVAARHRDIATVERTKSRRGGRVYLDFLQNRRGQTVVPPYAVRPVPAASVSAPLDWDELDGGLDPADFTILTMPERLERLGDLFAGTLHDRQALLSAIGKFQERYLPARDRGVLGRSARRRSAT